MKSSIVLAVASLILVGSLAKAEDSVVVANPESVQFYKGQDTKFKDANKDVQRKNWGLSIVINDTHLNIVNRQYSLSQYRLSLTDVLDIESRCLAVRAKASALGKRIVFDKTKNYGKKWVCSIQDVKDYSGVLTEEADNISVTNVSLPDDLGNYANLVISNSKIALANNSYVVSPVDNTASMNLINQCEQAKSSAKTSGKKVALNFDSAFGSMGFCSVAAEDSEK